eukprot:5456914-Pyramimonas_sp.AAC.1
MRAPTVPIFLFLPRPDSRQHHVAVGAQLQGRPLQRPAAPRHRGEHDLRAPRRLLSGPRARAPILASPS